jgi:hypothetical protein
METSPRSLVHKKPAVTLSVSSSRAAPHADEFVRKALLVSRFLRSQKKRRVKRSNLARNRRVSHTLLQEGINDGLFRREYRMSPASFYKLVDLLRGTLEPKDVSQARGDYKTYTIVIHLSSILFMVHSSTCTKAHHLLVSLSCPCNAFILIQRIPILIVLIR